MAWYVWSFLLLLLCCWLVLLYKSLVWLGCCACCCRCRPTTTRKGVTRDADGNILACTFCAIAQQPQPPDNDAHRHLAAVAPSTPASTPSPQSGLLQFDTIHDPTAGMPPAQLATALPTLTPVLYSTPWLVVFSPRHPCAARHLLVVPRKHIDDCSTLVSMATTAAQQRKRGQEQLNGSSRVDDYGEDGTEEEDTDDERYADESDEPSSRLRRRRWSLEEEKELTAQQYLAHMTEVGEMLLNNPHLLADPNGGTRLGQAQQQRNSRLRRWVRRIDCRRGGRRMCKSRRRSSRTGRVERSSAPLEAGEEEEEEEGREEQMEQERSEKQQLLLDTGKAKINGHQHAQVNGSNGRSKDDRANGHLLNLSLPSPSTARRRTPHSPYPSSTVTRSNPATPTLGSRTLSSASSPCTLPTSLSPSASHVVGVADGASGGGAALVAGQRFAFHAPPHNSIAHLHLHCFQLPFDHWWSEWNFRPNSRWCKDAEVVMDETERASKQPG